MKRRVGLVALCALLAIPAAAAEDGWVKASEENGITIFTREKAGTAIKELKAVGVVDAPPHVCMNVVLDVEHFKDFMPYTKESTVEARESERVIYSYQHLALPLISDRDYTLRIVDETPETAPGADPPYYKKAWSPANERGPKPKDGVERVKINSGFWRFDPVAGGSKSRLTYYVFTDPGGMIPSFVANKANTQAIPNLFAAVREQSKQARYQGKRSYARQAGATPEASPGADAKAPSAGEQPGG